ncbi:hypothetical protein EVAR_65249_1 [Eumeta japonica]|uniref:Uncharacterized protein n=1 Tax=Eumeta variegata TaxID=151549 RepID=A0A4C1ZS37_EUMVA|nr:hypothetical protein EVAR_65249_1 [Eumeta japonica]
MHGHPQSQRSRLCFAGLLNRNKLFSRRTPRQRSLEIPLLAYTLASWVRIEYLVEESESPELADWTKQQRKLLVTSPLYYVRD